jgi:hypothetical protein
MIATERDGGIYFGKWVQTFSLRTNSRRMLNPWEGEKSKTQSILQLTSFALHTLLICLNTKNIVKRTETNTRFRNTHKKSKPQFQGPQGAIYVSTTRLEAPAVSAMVQEVSTRGSPRPHLRRGHSHTVLRGVGRTERRAQWYPAVFVNGDPGHAPGRLYVVQGRKV